MKKLFAEFKKFIWDSHAEMDPTEMRSMMAESDLQVSIMQSKGKRNGRW